MENEEVHMDKEDVGSVTAKKNVRLHHSSRMSSILGKNIQHRIFINLQVRREVTLTTRIQIDLSYTSRLHLYQTFDRDLFFESPSSRKQSRFETHVKET